MKAPAIFSKSVAETMRRIAAHEVPFDGNPVLVRLSAIGWVEGAWKPEQLSWSCGGGTFVAGITEATHWMPLPDELEELKSVPLLPADNGRAN